MIILENLKPPITERELKKERHYKAFQNVCRRYVYSDAKDKSDVFKAIYHGVSMINATEYDTIKNLSYEYFGFFESINSLIALLSPRELMQIFPVEKTYDGEKWNCKDYFSTMEAMREHGLDTPIGDGVLNFLWDYFNESLSFYVVNYLGAINQLYKNETGRDMTAEFFADQGISFYRKFTADDGKEYLRDTKSGEFRRVRKPPPDGWKMIKY